ncbi:MAG: class I SAM-dependent methyltransferase [Ardenticatenaceae bacterium]|nr:class I SAM-dependent methyltransferase [Ardenticatenaceae bacterium]
MKEVHCNLCGQNDYSVRYPATLGREDHHAPDARAFRCTSLDYGRHAQIVTCNKCGHVYANPVWDEDELLMLYGDVEDTTYIEERIGRVLTFQKHLKAFEKITGPGNGRTLLDVGAYIGVFVDVACQAGWNASGVEPSAWAVEIARQQHLPILHGTLDHPDLAANSFEAITMWDVIEHVADPAGELAKAYKLLKPGGYIAVHTMDIDSLLSRLLGPRWPWLMTMHIQFFSQRTLATMLEKVGFEIVWSAVQGRYLRLNYLSSRLTGVVPAAGSLFDQAIHAFNIADRPIPINFGDLFTIYAKKVS